MAVQKAIWENCQVLDKWTSKKGTSCCKIGWMNRDGAGDHTFYGEEFDKLNVGDQVTIRATMTEDGFARNPEIQVLSTTGLGDTSSPAPSARSASGRPKRSSAAA